MRQLLVLLAIGLLIIRPAAVRAQSVALLGVSTADPCGITGRDVRFGFGGHVSGSSSGTAGHSPQSVPASPPVTGAVHTIEQVVKGVRLVVSFVHVEDGKVAWHAEVFPPTARLSWSVESVGYTDDARVLDDHIKVVSDREQRFRYSRTSRYVVDPRGTNRPNAVAITAVARLSFAGVRLTEAKFRVVVPRLHALPARR